MSLSCFLNRVIRDRAPPLLRRASCLSRACLFPLSTRPCKIGVTFQMYLPSTYMAVTGRVEPVRAREPDKEKL
jgi:hypothetical protein